MSIGKYVVSEVIPQPTQDISPRLASWVGYPQGQGFGGGEYQYLVRVVDAVPTTTERYNVTVWRRFRTPLPGEDSGNDLGFVTAPLDEFARVWVFGPYPRDVAENLLPCNSYEVIRAAVVARTCSDQTGYSESVSNAMVWALARVNKLWRA